MRYEAEYFLKEYTLLEKKLSTYPTIKTISKQINCGPFGSNLLDTEYVDDGVLVVRPFNIKQIKIENENLVYIKNSTVTRNNLKLYAKNTVLFSRVGDIKVGLLTKETATISPNIIALSIDDKITAYNIALFFNTKYGYKQIERHLKIAAQPTISTEIIENLKIPLYSYGFSNKLYLLVEQSFNYENQSQTLYTQATDLLEETLGLKNWQPSQENINVQRFSNSFAATGRLDAEYYQPMFEELERIITKNNFYRLADLVENISTGFPYDSSKFLEEGIKLIRINNITQQGLNLDNAACLTEYDAGLSPKDKIKKNDIVISMSGTIGLSCCVKEEVNAYINQRIMKFSAVNYNPDVLVLIINSIVGKTQLERVGTGGVQTNLSNTDILNIKIPEISNSKQTEIANLINTSYNLKAQSTQLLDKAKRAVEIAIEEGEDAALFYLDLPIKV